ncbi:MAG: ATP-binding protein [Desulfobacteraceae bacterium]|nr:ATP-binding protein [Desulfobacteraceae bacterium]
MNKTLVLSATLENLGTLMSHGRDAAVACGMDAKAIHQVELALEEVLVNVINYAYDQSQDQDQSTVLSKIGDIELDCSCTSNTLTITVADQGPAFNPLDQPDPDTTLSVEERTVGGLGIFLTKQMMDTVTYENSRGKNILTLVKHFKE